MELKRVYKAMRANFANTLRANDALAFARSAIASNADYGTREAVTISLDNGKTFSARPTEFARTSPWNPVYMLEGSCRALRWVEDTARAGLRFVGFADEIESSGIRHQGWFTEDDGFSGETLRGAVWQLPARDGCAMYVGGYIDPNNDGAACIDIDTVTGEYRDDDDSDAKRDAARSADSLAEFVAESEREHNRHWQTSRDVETLCEDITSARVRHSHNVASYKLLTTTKHVSDVLREDSARLRASVAESAREIREKMQSLPNGKLVE